VPLEVRPGSLVRRLETATRLLVIEDEADIADFLRAYFRASGYELVHVDPVSADEVVAVVDNEQPACVLLDYRLRGFSGGDAYRLLRSHDRFAFTPVIVITADINARPAVAEHSSGIDAFVSKPFNVNALAELVADRIAAAGELAAVGRDDTYDVMTQRYLDARLADEFAVAAHHGGRPLAFAMLHLRKITHGLGSRDDASTFVVRELIDFLRARLPSQTVIGRMDTDELALVVPNVAPAELLSELDRALDEVRCVLRVPGAKDVIVDVVAGVAGYPEHAHAPDALFMAADAALADAIDSGARVRVAL
jgi:PleD family two-component response regulator